MVSLRLFSVLLAVRLLSPAPAHAQSWAEQEVDGSFVTVAVEMEGDPVPLYSAPDGSGRFYLEARKGERYAVRIRNRTGERLGVLLSVDGLNSISGERQLTVRPWGRGQPGRMYVLEPWADVSVRGWRTSLEEVRRFTFVDEKRSYAERSGKANSKMGWIEVMVFRERDRYVPQPLSHDDRVTPSGGRAEAEAPSSREDRQARAPAPESAPSAPSRDAAGAEAEPSESDEMAAAPREKRSFPGTGWGSRSEDHAVVVQFEPEREATERVTLRYEYRAALVELGILPRPWNGGDRLAERDGGGGSFARPPAR